MTRKTRKLWLLSEIDKICNPSIHDFWAKEKSYCKSNWNEIYRNKIGVLSMCIGSHSRHLKASISLFISEITIRLPKNNAIHGYNDNSKRHKTYDRKQWFTQSSICAQFLALIQYIWKCLLHDSIWYCGDRASLLHV